MSVNSRREKNRAWGKAASKVLLPHCPQQSKVHSQLGCARMPTDGSVNLADASCSLYSMHAHPSLSCWCQRPQRTSCACLSFFRHINATYVKLVADIPVSQFGSPLQIGRSPVEDDSAPWHTTIPFISAVSLWCAQQAMSVGRQYVDYRLFLPLLLASLVCVIKNQRTFVIFRTNNGRPANKN